MKIEMQKSVNFHPGIINVWKDNPKKIADFQEAAAKQVQEMMKLAIRNAIHNNMYFLGDAIEISVAVSIGDPEEEEV